MEVKLSQVEVTETAAQVVRLMKQEGLVSTIPHIAAENGDEVAENAADIVGNHTSNTSAPVAAMAAKKRKSTAPAPAEAATKSSRIEPLKPSATATPQSTATPPSSTVSATDGNVTYTMTRRLK